MAESLEDRARELQSQAASASARAGSAGSELAGRFDRQERFAPLGRHGQERLASARATIVGCGALGGVLAQTLFRAGVGELDLIDRDVVEPSNLPRQVLFDERHAKERVPKALAAQESLERSGGPTRVRAHVTQLDESNVAALVAGTDLVLDGTDNLETRYLLNDFCVERSLPWIYAGVVGASGLLLPVLPGRSACLRCIFPVPPPSATLPTCDSAGVILPAVGAIASLASGIALRLLGSADADFAPQLVEIDAWSGRVRSLEAMRDPACPACARREFSRLSHPTSSEPIVLCGRNAVQVPGNGARLDLATLVLPAGAGDVVRSSIFLRFTLDGASLTLFADGRALVEGTTDPARALALHGRVLQRRR